MEFFKCPVCKSVWEGRFEEQGTCPTCQSKIFFILSKRDIEATL